ncbi:TetR family transcriptional regulator [Pseudomonas aeruginosa]|nr:TetR family transcriptional regulator [Pseudomonas aeruginosa]
MSDMNETKDRVADAPGKRALLEAALRLGSSSRSLGAIGLRELAREAGLNPNTFYRHFRDIDDLGLTMIRDISTSCASRCASFAARPRLRAAPGAPSADDAVRAGPGKGAAGLPGDGAAVLRLRGEQSRRVHRRRARTAWGFAGAAWCPASDHG